MEHSQYKNVIVTSGSYPPSNLPNEDLRGWKCRRGLSIAQIICGVIEVVAGITVIYLPVGGGFDVWGYVGGAIWNGLFVIITGYLGACTRRRRSMVVAYMVTSIVAAVMGALLVVYSIFGIFCVALADLFYEYQTYPYGEYQSANLAMYFILSVAFGLQGLISIIGASFSCCAACNKTNSPVQIAYYNAFPTPTTSPAQVPPYTTIPEAPPSYTNLPGAFQVISPTQDATVGNLPLKM